MKVFKVYIDGKNSSPLVCDTVSEVLEYLQPELEDGDSSGFGIIIEISSMTKEEFDALPEWDGP